MVLSVLSVQGLASAHSRVRAVGNVREVRDIPQESFNAVLS